jgi:ATP synthase protein I
MHQPDTSRAKRILLLQAAVALLVAAVGAAFGLAAGLSALIGGGTAAAANTLFATGVFGPYEARRPGRIVARFVGAELFKLFFIVTVFAAVFAWAKPVSVVVLLGAFLVVQVLPLLLANWVAR